MARVSKTEPEIEIRLPGRSFRKELLLDGKVAIECSRPIEPLVRLLIEKAAGVQAQTGIAQIASGDALPIIVVAALKREQPAHYFNIDLYHTQTGSDLARNANVGLAVHCASDLPVLQPPPDLVLMQCTKDGEAGLTLEFIRQARARMAGGGKLLVTINNPHDKWVRDQLERIFGNLSLLARIKQGLVYSVKNSAEHQEKFSPEQDQLLHYRKRNAVRDRP